MQTLQIPQRLISVYHILKFTYGIVPIVAGLDKFTNLLTNWEQYLNPTLVQVLPFTPHTFMLLVGVIEITAGLLVFLKPAVGGYIVMAWLALIGLSLLATKEFLDVAVRDLVMAVGAYTFVQIVKIAGASKPEGIDTQKVAFS